MLAPSLVSARVAHVYVWIITVATVQQDFDPYLSIQAPGRTIVKRDEIGTAGQHNREFKRQSTCEVYLGMHVTKIYLTVKHTNAIFIMIYLEILPREYMPVTRAHP